MQTWFVIIVPKFLNYVTISKDLFAIFMLQSCLALCSREMNVLSFLSISFWINHSTVNYKFPCFYLQYSSIYPLKWHRNNNHNHHERHQLYVPFHNHIVISMFMILLYYFKANTSTDFGLVALLIHYVKRPVKSIRVWFPRILWKQNHKFIRLPSLPCEKNRQRFCVKQNYLPLETYEHPPPPLRNAGN